jgi:hypothetical protein
MGEDTKDLINDFSMFDQDLLDLFQHLALGRKMVVLIAKIFLSLLLKVQHLLK